MKTEMSWETIINIPAWSSLSRVTANPAQVLPGIYQVADGAYLVTQTYDRSLEEGIAGSPFTTLAVWAGGEDALRRCINSDASIYVPSPTKIPPPTILCGTQGIYSELERKLTASESESAERAVYSNKGAFVHKLIQIGRFSFCFLEQKIQPEERVYAIQIRLA